MIERAPEKAARESYDLIIVGAGIYGTTLALEACFRNLRVLIVERADFGGATSWNSLRIVHGGLRYLQTGDLLRFRESVQERSWFLRTFPEQVVPLACLMPLYGDGLKKPSMLRAALMVNDFLSRRRNRGVRPDRRLPEGGTIGLSEVVSLFPSVDQHGLRAGALWYDAFMPDSQRILMQMLHWACSRRTVALNYVEAERLLLDGPASRVAGLAARDRETGAVYEYRAPIVVNCAGPWCRELADRWDRHLDRLFRPSLAFNLFIDHPPPASVAVAVTPRQPGGRTYFVVPWKDRILAGTFHAPLDHGAAFGPPAETQVEAFLEDLRRAIPRFRVTRDHVLRIHWGRLPVRTEGSVRLAGRPVIHEHATNDGPRGLYSVSGVKFTTARRVAEDVLRTIYGSRNRAAAEQRHASRPEVEDPPGIHDLQRMTREDGLAAEKTIRRLVLDEAVVHLDDVLLRRTDWGVVPGKARWTAELVGRVLGWSDAREKTELTRLEDAAQPPAFRSAPTASYNRNVR